MTVFSKKRMRHSLLCNNIYQVAIFEKKCCLTHTFIYLCFLFAFDIVCVQNETKLIPFCHFNTTIVKKKTRRTLLPIHKIRASETEHMAIFRTKCFFSSLFCYNILAGFSLFVQKKEQITTETDMDTHTHIY